MAHAGMRTELPGLIGPTIFPRASRERIAKRFPRSARVMSVPSSSRGPRILSRYTLPSC